MEEGTTRRSPIIPPGAVQEEWTMDGGAFDRLARLLAGQATRRAGLSGLAGALGLLAGEAAGIGAAGLNGGRGQRRNVGAK